MEVKVLRNNDYRFVSARALDACSTYGVESISLVAVKTRAQAVCASRHTSARIWVVGADVAQAARQEGLTNSTTTEEVSK